MASKVLDAVNKLLQFGSHTHPDAPISRKDLSPVLAAVATALSDIDSRLQKSEGGTKAN